MKSDDGIFGGLTLRLRPADLEKCNNISSRFGLTLTESEMKLLERRRTEALRDNGRVEFGGGVLERLVYAFCDSPLSKKSEYAETMASLQDCFYRFKNESCDRLTDDEIIDRMKIVFDGRAQGSCELLEGMSVADLFSRDRGDLYFGEGEE